MTKLTLLTLLMFGFIISHGQNIHVTFTGKGAATQIDSVIATNFAKNKSVTLPGNETLILAVNTGVPLVSELINLVRVFPNPFSGRATFTTIVQKPQTVLLNVQNLIGQVIAQTKTLIQPGENEFALFVNTAGIYLVNFTTELRTFSYKVVCSEATQSENKIQFQSTVSGSYKDPFQPQTKSSPTEYTLDFTVGDIICYQCKSGLFTTILSDSPASSKNYEVEFAACTDPDGKSYSIVKIGMQTWMAENLAWLPAVSPSSAASDTDSYNYVHGYEGRIVASAKRASNYTTYGVLYNWPAASKACPSGWHLPTDEEWKVLEKNQGMSQSDADLDGNRTSGSVGGKLKEAGTSHWLSPNTSASNRIGFTALPGGIRYSGGFDGRGGYAYFWSASTNGTANAWYRTLDSSQDGVYRYNFSRSCGYSVRCLLN